MMRMFRFLVLFGLVRLSLVAAADSVCHPPYGCFTDAPPFDRAFVPWPQSPKEVGTRLLLYTRSSPHKYELLSDMNEGIIEKSTYDPSRSTRFIIHGYAAIDSESTIIDVKSWWGMRMKDELLRKSDDNVIIVDWIRGAKIPYVRAAANTRLVGAQVTKFIETVLSLSGGKEIDHSPLHIIGFSLGAHVGGYVGRRLKAKGIDLDRISGLDPATLLFKGEHRDVRMDATDAKFVDVIHTSYMFGITAPQGHLDFYPNGGTSQKGCSILDLPCPHVRAALYFTESINSPHCPWRGYRCSSSDAFNRGLCLNCVNGCPTLGYSADKYRHLAPGKFYLYTTGPAPFCGFHYLITLYTGTDWFFSGLSAHVYINLQGTRGSSGEIKLIERELDKGSQESFVAISPRDVGTLQSITVWHKHVAELWKVKKVTVRPGWKSSIYTACFHQWIHYQDKTQRQLVLGHRSC